MKAICQLYLPAFYRSYSQSAVKQATKLLGNLKQAGFDGVYLIALFEDGGYDDGFDIVKYAVNHRFGAEEEFYRLVDEAHRLDLTVGVDFARVDCGMMLLEDVSKADPSNPFACLNPAESIAAIRKVSGGMPLFFEWFDPSTADLFNDLPECWALDCSFVITGRQSTEWNHPKLIPLVGGHDQMTLADRGLDVCDVLGKMANSEYAFLDIQTLIQWRTDPMACFGYDAYDANLENPNQRYRARGPIAPVIADFIATL